MQETEVKYFNNKHWCDDFVDFVVSTHSVAKMYEIDRAYDLWVARFERASSVRAWGDILEEILSKESYLAWRARYKLINGGEE